MKIEIASLTFAEIELTSKLDSTIFNRNDYLGTELLNTEEIEFAQMISSTNVNNYDNQPFTTFMTSDTIDSTVQIQNSNYNFLTTELSTFMNTPSTNMEVLLLTQYSQKENIFWTTSNFEDQMISISETESDNIFSSESSTSENNPIESSSQTKYSSLTTSILNTQINSINDPINSTTFNRNYSILSTETSTSAGLLFTQYNQMENNSKASTRKESTYEKKIDNILIILGEHWFTFSVSILICFILVLVYLKICKSIKNYLFVRSKRKQFAESTLDLISTDYYDQNDSRKNRPVIKSIRYFNNETNAKLMTSINLIEYEYETATDKPLTRINIFNFLKDRNSILNKYSIHQNPIFNEENLEGHIDLDAANNNFIFKSNTNSNINIFNINML